jgi:hypothetical protein
MPMHFQAIGRSILMDHCEKLVFSDKVRFPTLKNAMALSLFGDGFCFCARSLSRASWTETYNNAPSGTYTSRITDVTAAGFQWDGNTPSNEFKKP